MECATETADKFRLGLGSKLVVHSAQRTLASAERVIGLDKASGKPVVGKLALAEGPSEETTFIATLFQIDQERPLSGVSVKIMGFLASTKEVKSVLERAKADKLVALKVFLAKAVLDHLAVKLLHTGGQRVLKLEVGKKLGEQVKVNAVISRVARPRPYRRPWLRESAVEPGRRHRGPGSSRGWHRR